MRSLLFCCLVLLSGCMTSEETDPAVLQEFMGTSAAPVVVSELKPSDIVELSVEVNGLPQVPATQVELSEDSVGTFPLIGDVDLSGLTRPQAKARIEKEYGALYVNPPMISFSVVRDEVSDAWGYVTVLGLVKTPGRVAISSAEGIHLSEALKQAGGFDLGAKRDALKITRRDDVGEKQQCVINFKQIAYQGDADLDLLLRAGDIVHVPERLF